MNHPQLTAALLAATTLMYAFSAAHAQDWDRTQTNTGVAYVSGGIGSASREALSAREKDFNFKLISTIAGTGTYVSDVVLTITSSAGKPIAQHTTQGPLFMANLPKGTYTMRATFRDQTQTRNFQINEKRLHIEYLRWLVRADEDWALPWQAP